MFIAHLHQRLRLYTIGWMNLNVVIHSHDAPRSGHPIEAATPEIIESTILFWLIDEWKCTSLLRPQAYHMAQWFQFCMNNWVWKSYRQDGCRICSLWTINATVWQFQNNVWRCFNVIRWISASIHYCGRNMDPLLHTRDEGTVKTMDFTGWTSSEEGVDRKVD